MKKPERIYSYKKDKNIEIHHVFDCKFKIPKNILSIEFRGKDIIENFLAVQILFYLAEDLFNEQYSRQMENFHLKISFNYFIDCVSIKLEGFSTKILEMTENFFKLLDNLSLDRLEMVKKALNDHYSHILTQSPYKRLLEVFSSKYFSKKSSEELLEQLKTIEKSEIKLPKSFEVRVSSVGNLEFSDLVNFIGKLDLLKNTENKENNTNAESDNRKIENKDNQFDSLSFLTNDKNNNAIALFFNINNPTEIPAPNINYEADLKESLVFNECQSYRHNSCMGRLINQIAHEQFFNQLRTAEQFGYVVYSYVQQISSAEYLIFVIQSTKSAEVLEKKNQ